VIDQNTLLVIDIVRILGKTPLGGKANYNLTVTSAKISPW